MISSGASRDEPDSRATFRAVEMLAVCQIVHLSGVGPVNLSVLPIRQRRRPHLAVATRAG